MTSQSRPSLLLFLPTLALLGLAQLAMAQGSHAPAASPTTSSSGSESIPNLSAVEWLKRMHGAAKSHSYMGTFVVSVAAGNLSSARIWHACEGDIEIERVDVLSGPPRTTFRRNEQVLTFLPDQRVIKSEKRENSELFPNLLGAPDSAIGDFYGVKIVGKGRVAGFDTDVIQLMPRDNMRFGYRVWIERRSGLLTKLQTVDSEGRVVEQSAFSELQLDAPVKVQALSQMMGSTAGYKLEKSQIERTTADAEGWALSGQVPGFKPTSCYRRLFSGAAGGDRTLQWTFSDGLATVSLFLEPFDPKRDAQEGLLALGATNTLTRKISGPRGDWWLTAVGEVPPRTLEAFAQNLIRQPR